MNNESYYSDTRDWESDENRILYWAVALAIPVGIIGFRLLMRGGPLLFVIVFALLIFIFYQILDALVPPSLTKTFYASRDDAEQIVENILEEKKYPYEWRRNRFQLTDMQIKVKTRRNFGLGKDGCPFAAVDRRAERCDCFGHP